MLLSVILAIQERRLPILLHNANERCTVLGL